MDMCFSCIAAVLTNHSSWSIECNVFSSDDLLLSCQKYIPNKKQPGVVRKGSAKQSRINAITEYNG